MDKYAATAIYIATSLDEFLRPVDAMISFPNGDTIDSNCSF